MSLWWQEFFDEEYLELWSHLYPASQCESDAESIRTILNLGPGDRILDAACGYGRMSLPFAKLGLSVLGVDYSADLLARANADAAECKEAIDLVYQEADLRTLELNASFDAAVSLFSSLGYGSEDDDLRTLQTIANALVPGGQFLLETVHRDAIVTRRALGQTTGFRGPNGLTLREKNTFNPVRGEIHSTWSWNSPTYSGSKHSVIRMYSASELVSLLTRAGFVEIRCYCGFSDRPFDETSLDERLGILSVKAG